MVVPLTNDLDYPDDEFIENVKDEVEKEVLEDEKVAKGSFDNLNDSKTGSDEDGQSDRV